MTQKHKLEVADTVKHKSEGRREQSAYMRSEEGRFQLAVANTSETLVSEKLSQEKNQDPFLKPEGRKREREREIHRYMST